MEGFIGKDRGVVNLYALGAMVLPMASVRLFQYDILPFFLPVFLHRLIIIYIYYLLPNLARSIKAMTSGDL